MLKVAIAAVFLALLAPHFASSHAQAQAHGQAQFDPTRLVFETVAGDYGNIYNVIQDRDGFLWLAGVNGTKKYNGYETETIYSGGTVSALFEDSEGLIWMVIRSGVAVYDKKTGNLTQYDANPNEPNALSGASLVFFQKTQLLAEDKDGHIWIGATNGLNKFDKKTGKFSAYKSAAGAAETLLDNDVWSVLTAKDGSLWVGTVTGLHKFDPRTGRVLERYAVNDGDPDALHGKNVQATLEDGEGHIWAGAAGGGLNRLDPGRKTVVHYQEDGKGPKKIANNFIYRLARFESAPDLVWITTLDGLSILNTQDNTVINYVHDPEKAGKGDLGGKIVHTIIQDKSGIFWLVVNEHGFLQKVDPGARNFQTILRSKNLQEGFADVSCPVRLGPDGNIWVTEVTTGIARVNPKTGRLIGHFLHDPQQPDSFPAHIEDFVFDPRQEDIVWVVAKGMVAEYNWRTQTVVKTYPSGTQSKIWPLWTDKQNPDLFYGTVWGEGLLKFNKKTGQAVIFATDPANPAGTLSGTPYPALPSYYQMQGNQMWLNVFGAGLDLFDFDTGKVVRKHLFNPPGFTNQEFEAIASYIDSKGRFWMGHNQYDLASGKFTPFKSLYGYSYPSTVISSLAQDKRGLLWASGMLDGTITRLDPETGKTKVFTERDGVSPGLACSYPPVTLPDGQIWMAGSGGITYFHPDRIVDNPYQAPVYITQLTQGGKPLRLGTAPERAKELTLNWNENFFEFEMAALSYRRPEANQYQYMLKGVDKDWYGAGRRRSGRYSGLPPGTYTLHVRGSNNDGVWSGREATLVLTITPPWWHTWWFRSMVFAVLATLAFTIYRLRVRSIEQRAWELKRLVSERTSELQAAEKGLRSHKEKLEITVQERTEALLRVNRELRALSECNEAVLHADGEEALLAKVCQIICGTGGYRFAWVGYREFDAEKSIRYVASAGVEDKYLEGARLTWADTERGRGPSGAAIRTGRSVTINDFAAAPEAAPWREAALRRGYRSSVALPLKDDAGNTFGILNIYSAQASAFTPGETRLLEELANDLAFGIRTLRIRAARAQAEEELCRIYRELIAMNACTHMLMRADSETAMFQGLCRIICEEAGYLMSWAGSAENDEGKTIRVIASSGFDEGYIERARLTWADTPRGRGPGGLSVRTGKTAVCRDLTTDPNMAPWREDALRRGYSSVIAVPLKDDSGRAFGCFGAYSAKADAFTESEVRFLETMASDVAFAVMGMRARIGRQRAEESLRRHKEQLEAIVQERTAELNAAVDELERGRDRLEIMVQERTADLLLARDAAEAANRAKSAFLTNMSHQLRTPLNAVLGFSEILRSDPRATKEQRERLGIINHSGETLLKLVTEILEITRMEAGQLEVDIAPFNPGDMLREVADVTMPRAREKGLQLLVDYSSAVPRCIKADRRRLRQVLLNLVDNAVKFTKAGCVTVRASFKPDAQPHLVMEVEDTGPGISPEDQKRIFQAFERLAEAGTQTGAGLGLAITRQFVEFMGGSISVTSEPGKGSVFRVEAPVEVAEARAEERSAVASDVAGLAPGTPRYRILIAEDEAENLLLLRQLMDRLGFEVKSAANGEECVKLFQEWHPHLIWMDRRMPVMDGMEAARCIRRLPDGRDVKIIAVTASVFKYQQQEMLDAGMDGLVCKPYRFDEIYGSLARQLGVEFVYKTAAEAVPAPARLTPELLETLPADLRAKLKEAVESLEHSRIEAAIREVRAADEVLALTLMRSAENFDYPAILNVLGPDRPQQESPGS